MSTFLVVALALVAAQAQPPASPPAEAQPQQQPAASQQPTAPQPLEVITLDDALRAAAERSLDIRILEAQLDQAEEISWKAWSGYLPRATVAGTAQLQREQVAQFPVDFSDPSAGTIPITTQPDQVIRGQLDVQQVILSPSLIFGIRQANATERAAALSIGNGRRALLFGVASAYYGAASLKQALAVSERLLEIAQRQEKDARVRFQAGTIAKVGLLRAEIDRARAEQDLKRARNAFQSARLALATLLARDAEFDVTEPPPPALPADPGAEELVKVALERRPDVLAARAQLDAARAGRSATIGRYFPNLGAFWQYQRASEGGAFGGEKNYAYGLSLTWQVLDGGLRESDLRESRAKIAEADAAARRAELGVRQEVLQALLDLDSARANAAKAREQRELAAENLRLVDVSYRAGAATAVELADATAALRNAEIGATTEGLNAQLAALRVLHATGEPEPSATAR